MTGPGGRVLPLDEIALPGAPQRQQRARRGRRGPAASASRRTPSARAVAGFSGVEHRLELVAEVDGVRFVNDSQGTQPDAVIAGAAQLRARRWC